MYDTAVIDMRTEFQRGIAEAVEILRQGDVVAFPTETVYGLGADAMRVEAVRAIFAAKGRPADNPLIVHVASPEGAMDIAHVTRPAQELMDAFWPGPLTIVMDKRSCIPYEVTAGLPTVAVRMPDNEVALTLIEESGLAIAAPSANSSGRPSPTRALDVLEDMNDRIPLILDGGQCLVGVESTVVSLKDGHPVVLRPGAITPGMIHDVLGECGVADSVLAPLKSGEAAPSPGMKYKHYAPRAKVVIIDGDIQEIANTTIDLYDSAVKSGKHCLIIATSQTSDFYGGCDYAIMGDRNDPASACRALFAFLRDADRSGVDEILLEALPAQAMGRAFMNRALRASGFQVVHAHDE